MNAAEIARFHRIDEIFDGALAREPGAARESWLREACAGDQTLYDDVAACLREHHTISTRRGGRDAMPRFGAWQATRLLGRGGMGTVYLAERADGAFRMQAAVKVVPLALASPDIEERFRRERQFLASLDHPRIARLIDGGVSEHDIPWLAMEFIDGLPIDRYCREHGVDAQGCVSLLRQLMEALAYIHERKVVHRDLKPSNVLVDGSGRVKLLDFGTARLADAGGGDAITQTGVFALTPDYASPEQMAGEPATFASDIYSAGLVLRKILPGGKPDAKLAPAIAKALESLPRDRYASAAEMDRDLERYIAGEPVGARRSISRWLIPVLAACGVLASAFGFAFWIHAHIQPAAPSVAVMPFSDFSADPANRYFSQGLTEEITDTLSHFKTLRVIAQSSATQAHAKSASVRDAGRALNVGTVLEGSVLRSGDRLKIVADLERVSDGAILWSNTYERKAADLFAVQTELASDIAANLRVAASGQTAHIPRPEAHEAWLRGFFEMNQMTVPMLALAEADYQRAIDLDPDYAAAYYGLAAAKYDRFVARGSLVQRTDEERLDTERLLRKALDLEPGLGSAHALLAAMLLQYDWDWRRAEQELRTAVASSSSANAESWLAMLQVFRGQFEEAEPHIRSMLDLDPLGVATLNNLCVIRRLEKRPAEARSIGQRIATEHPGMVQAQEMIGATYVEENRPELAMPIFQAAEQRDPQVRMFEAMTYAAEGKRADALRLERPFEESYPATRVSLVYLATFYALLGDDANALKWLSRSADRHEFQILGIGEAPVFARLRGLAGFRAIEHRVGLE